MKNRTVFRILVVVAPLLAFVTGWSALSAGHEARWDAAAFYLFCAFLNGITFGICLGYFFFNEED